MHVRAGQVPAVAAKSEQAFANELQDCDVAVMLFDVTDAKSVEFLEAVQRRIPSHVPCVYLGNKSDSGAARPALGPGAALAQSYSLAEPDAVSLQPPPAAQLNEEWQKNIDRLFQVLLATALLPKAARPMTEEQHALARRRRFVTALKRVSLLAGVLGGVVGLGVWWYRGGGSAKAPVGRAAKEDA
jgi:DNA-binding NarL/FixJ family response regulator